MYINNNNISFNGRCPQIRDAQWVSHMVNSAYPHISTSRLSADIKVCQNNCVKPSEKDKFNKILDWKKKIRAKLKESRKEWHNISKNDYRLINNVINQLRYDKLGNCGEDAYLAETILKINGVDNACTAGLKFNGKPIDHCVCVFNKDGSKFKGRVSKNTIIIDPWFYGAADFASNMFLKYKNIGKKFFPEINDSSKFSFRDIVSQEITGEERFLLALKYRNLVFHSKNNSRELMQ